MSGAHRADKRHPHLGEVIVATEVITSGPGPRRVRNIILLLASSVALMMTGSGIITPVFARRLSEFGSGVAGLGLLKMSFALAQLVASPFMGALADRWGRRPLILMALAAFAVANVGFLWAPSMQVLIIVRALGAVLTAGLFPASMGVVADIAPERDRARWVGIVMGSYGAGLIFGPVLGGVLYDGWGSAAPFATSAAVALTAFIAAIISVPETRTRETRWREELRQRRAAATAPEQAGFSWAALPRPLYVFGTLLLLDFIGTFAFAFVEPQLIFYVYEGLGWSTAQFGIVAGVYGLAMVVGQTLLGQASDRFGRKPMIVAGMPLAAGFFASMAFVTSFPLVLLTAIVAGLGEALTRPALSAFYFDITPEQHRSRIVGIKGSASSLGGVLGPLLVVGVSGFTSPQGIFVIAGVLTVAMTLLAAVSLREPRHVAVEARDLAWEVSAQRALAAQAALRGVVLRATAARQARGVA